MYLEMMESSNFTNPKSQLSLKKLVSERAAAIRTKADDIKRFAKEEDELLLNHAVGRIKFK